MNWKKINLKQRGKPRQQRDAYFIVFEKKTTIHL